MAGRLGSKVALITGAGGAFGRALAPAFVRAGATVFLSDVDRGALDLGPDLVVGYAKGTRCSDESAIGAVGRDVLTNNTRVWSGDHCMDHTAVPGILLANRKLRRPVTRLSDLGAALVAEF